MKYKIYCLIAILSLVSVSCTKLNESLNSELEEGKALNATQLLTSAYNTLYVPYIQEQRWVLQEISTDEAMAPTRGGDWDDNGVHRAIHLHTWNADNSYMNNTFVSLGTAIYQASNVLRNAPSAQQAAEAKFIRALTMFDMLDLWGIVPYRENLEDFRIDPITLEPQEAIDFIIKDINEALPELPADGEAFVANKNAARTLLMKIYLNKGTFLNRANPTFDAEDMNKVIELANEITGYTISPTGKYFDNFAPNNDEISTENIFTLYNENGDRGGAIDRTWNTIAHYNMVIGGWNGWCTLPKMIDRFTDGDERKGIYYNYPADTSGNRIRGYHRQNVGLLEGQQYSWVTNQPLNARNPSSQPLSFSKAVTIRTSGNTLETAGVRVLKYAYDLASQGGQKNNDWVVFRYADVLLMKAEAILRGGSGGGTSALTIVNDIRTKRGAPALTTIDLDLLLDERSRELYWEGWRRQDLIRFGKFLEAWDEKAADPDPKTLVYAIPSQQIAVNPNLTQNPGY